MITTTWKYLTISILLIGCSNVEGTEFSAFLKQLEKINTPVSFQTIAFTPPQTETKHSQALFEMYKAAYASHVVGKIYDSKKFVAIVYSVPGDVATPVLITYDNSGNKIDSLNLFENASGYSDESETYETVTMLADKRIQVIDSTESWPVDSSGEASEIPVIKVEHFLHRVNEQGKIIKHIN